jgi:hypothetical protein
VHSVRRVGVIASPRLVPLVGAYNFRDLGGHPTTDGRITRWRQLYRSDTLQDLSETGVSALRGIGLQTIIDLRTATELATIGRTPLEGEDIAYLHLSVIREAIRNDPSCYRRSPNSIWPLSTCVVGFKSPGVH